MPLPASYTQLKIDCCATCDHSTSDDGGPYSALCFHTANTTDNLPAEVNMLGLCAHFEHQVHEIPPKLCAPEHVPYSLQENNTIEIVAKKAFKRGLIAGITRFAWWKDGEQQLGTCGVRLKDELTLINNLSAEDLGFYDE